MRHLSMRCTYAIVLLLSLAASATAQNDGFRTATRMGGATRFHAPVRDLAAVRQMLQEPRSREGLATVLEEAGLGSLTPRVTEVLSTAVPGVLRETTIPVGATWQWMALRRNGQAGIVRQIRWGGQQMLEAFEFVVDDLNRTYTFVLIEECGNLALVSDVPSLEAARQAQVAEQERVAAAERERAAAAAAAAEAAARAERDRADAERAAAAARAEQERLAQERAAEEARLEAERQAEAARVAALERAKIDWFAAGFFGKERRVRNDLVGGECDPIFGVKFGPDIRLTDTVRFAPAIGVTINTDNGDNSSLFAEAEIRREFARAFIGGGAGVWDFNHSDTVAPSLLVDFGLLLNEAASGNKLYFTTEGRMFLNAADDIRNNYQFWGGLRYIWR